MYSTNIAESQSFMQRVRLFRLLHCCKCKPKWALAQVVLRL